MKVNYSKKIVNEKEVTQTITLSRDELKKVQDAQSMLDNMHKIRKFRMLPKIKINANSVISSIAVNAIINCVGMTYNGTTDRIKPDRITYLAVK